MSLTETVAYHLRIDDSAVRVERASRDVDAAQGAGCDHAASGHAGHAGIALQEELHLALGLGAPRAPELRSVHGGALKLCRRLKLDKLRNALWSEHPSWC